MIDELSARFDDSINDYDVPGTTADDEALFGVLVGWRETAWQNAQRLADATSDAERRQVADSIEAYAISQAELIYAGSAYGPGRAPLPATRAVHPRAVRTPPTSAAPTLPTSARAARGCAVGS